MFQHIIWDFDGTLFDTYPCLSQSLQKALKDLGVTAPIEEILSFQMISQSHAITHYQTVYALGNELKELFDRYQQEAGFGAVKPFPGIEALCKEIIRSGRWNYLYTHRGSSAIDAIQHYGMASCFKDFITKESGFPRKPSPDALLSLTEKHQMDKKKAIMIGDRDIDILAAKNAGIMACYIDYKTGTSCGAADYVIESAEQLYSVIGL
jgi:HAD superfamily hydrolase (TIGR01549 family)